MHQWKYDYETNTRVRQVDCIECNDLFDVRLTQDQLRQYLAGIHLQDIRPRVDINDRELLISGLCSDCFDKIFSDQGDE